MRTITSVIFSILLFSAVNVLAKEMKTDTENESFQTNDSVFIKELLASEELPVAMPPQELTERRARAEYVLLHFWDKMPWKVHEVSCNRGFVEQNFSNFIYLLPNVGDSILPIMQVLVDGCAIDSAAFSLVDHVAEKYLHDPNSPFRNDNFYSAYLEAVVNSSAVSFENKSRPAYLIPRLRLNQPGMQAGDLGFSTIDEKQHTLHSMPEVPMVVMFWSAGCENCDSMITQMGAFEKENEIETSLGSVSKASQELQKLAQKGQVQLLSLCIDGDKEAWIKETSRFPKGWIHGYCAGTFDQAATYYIHGTPSFYLISASKNVILKDAPIENLSQAIMQ